MLSELLACGPTPSRQNANTAKTAAAEYCHLAVPHPTSHQPALSASADHRSAPLPLHRGTALIHRSQPHRPQATTPITNRDHHPFRPPPARPTNGHPRPQPHRSCNSPQRRAPVRAVGISLAVVGRETRRRWCEARPRGCREPGRMLGSGLNLVSAALGFSMTAVFIAFVCARFICCRARGANDGGPPPLDFDADFPADLDRPIEHARCGLEPWVVGAIPTMKYNCEAFHSKDDAQCSICLGEYNEKEILRIIPTCRHNFHLTCLDVWLQKQTTCPMCRISLKELPGRKADVTPARSNPQPSTIPENSVNPTPEWFLPIHPIHRGTQNSPGTQESVEMVIEIRQ